MRRTESSAFRAPRRLAGPCALISAGVLAATLLVASPAVATDYPSWDDVVAAQNDESAKASQIAEIEGLIAGLQAEVEAAQAVADAAWQVDQSAQNALAAGQRKADGLAAQATEAEAEAATSSKRAASLAAQFARSAGNDLTSQLMVSGDDSDDLLYQLGAMSKLSETSKTVFDQAEQDANTADSLSKQAVVAKQRLEGLAAEAAASLQSARDAQADVQGALLEQEAHEAELTVQLNALKQNTALTTEQFNEGVRVERERQLAEEQARAEAAAEAERQRQAADDAGGSGSGGGGGGGPAPAPAPEPAPVNVAPPSQSYSGQAVVDYAEQFVGVVPYGYGADPSDSFGCDGLTQYVYGQFGIQLPRLVSRQAAMGVRVSAQDAAPGDLVVWPGSHIGIYDGHGGVIHSPDWGRYVTHANGLWGSYYFVRLV
ncbi:C40 family peptidase [Herbiconiux sp. CPCC 203407]|uniref:C40 family peptidase n=1 Tax=Herbiconiux oxytropis TaxID=2970915 RepID=A0AA42BV88_9MICO|nr:C40 family peptidase [Herbiconiux oxytropis]MCS5721377.1 C40 family peptidase [Herbiconiux oxytropis]MCS5726184.1 C40 family peptidase [Herbiconiux oxytropis]